MVDLALMIDSSDCGTVIILRDRWDCNCLTVCLAVGLDGRQQQPAMETCGTMDDGAACSDRIWEDSLCGMRRTVDYFAAISMVVEHLRAATLTPKMLPIS